MLNQVLPPSIDNTYRGYKLALWLFGVVVFVKMAQAVVVIFNGYSVLKSADGVPLETFTPASAQTVVSIWALYGLSRLFILLLCVLTLLRYRSAIPFMFTLLILNYLAGELILRFLPLVRTGTPPGPVVNLILFVLMIAGLGLSLANRSKPPLFTKL